MAKKNLSSETLQPSASASGFQPLEVIHSTESQMTTRVMQVPHGCIVHTATVYYRPAVVIEGKEEHPRTVAYVSEATVFVPGVALSEDEKGNLQLVSSVR